MGERCNGSDNERKQHLLQHKEKHNNMKKAYTDGSKSTGRKVGFAAVFSPKVFKLCLNNASV